MTEKGRNVSKKFLGDIPGGVKCVGHRRKRRKWKIRRNRNDEKDRKKDRK
jgi:hypothetical protein